MAKTVNNIKVRMYRQGLGDCFLIQFCNKEKTVFTMMIDCGVLLGTQDGAEKMKAVVNDIAKKTGNKIDVLTATHEHWDHVSGFVQAQKEFDGIEIGEIWLSWAENPQDVFAKKLKKDKELKLQALQALVKSNKQNQRFRLAEQALSFFAASEGKKTSDAMDYLKTRGTNSMNYYEPGDVITVDALPDIRFYVLGPPKDEASIKKNMSTSSDIIYKLGVGNDFLNQIAALENVTQGSIFDKKYILKDSESDIEKIYHAAGNEWKKIEDDYLDAANTIALALDSNTNNTSFVIAIESVKSGKVLLFPGDAQVGNWLSWGELSFETEDKKGKNVTINAENLLSRTVLYKVGHHGSHNATVKNMGLELMSDDDLVAMIPVDRAMAEKKDWEMPAEKLFEQLKGKASERIVMLDDNKVKTPAASSNYDKPKFKNFVKRVTSTDLYHELSIDV